MATEGVAVVSAFLQGVCDDLRSIIATSKLPLVVNDELGRLLKAFLHDQIPPTSTVEAAEDQPLKSKLIGAWLRELKEAAYDAADILDHLDDLQPPQLMNINVDMDHQVIPRRRHLCIFHSCTLGSSSTLQQHPAHDETVLRMISALRKRVKKLMRKLHSKEVLHLQPPRRLNGHYSWFGGSMGGFMPPEPRILEEDREKMIQLLTSEESSMMDTSLISIVGKRGVGKTTLARIIFDDQRVAGHFKLKLWVRASEIYDTARLLSSSIRESAGRDPLSDESMPLEALNVKLAGGRFLLILDDLQISSEKLDQLEMMFSHFQVHGQVGSKILVTTENDQEIHKKVRILPTSSYYLNGLSLADSWSLFRECACPDQWLDHHHQHSREFEEAGLELMAKLEGLPLAVRMLGCLMRSNVELDDWKMILNSDVWSQKQDGHVIPASLWLSYQHLPPHIKQCFSYCSIFPRDHKFNKESIVQMWMAQGLIQPRQGMQMEDTGNEYFDFLLQRSFFQSLSSRDKTTVYEERLGPFYQEGFLKHDSRLDLALFPNISEGCIMPSLIHDLAVSITPSESLYLSHSGCSMKKKVRHLSFESDSMIITEILDIGTLNNLRTLLLYRQRSSSFDYDVLFMHLKHIRVLFLSDVELKEFPKSIGNMKQLRCLDASETGIVTLRKEVCDLTKLQTLKLSSSNSSPLDLPHSILNLVNLRHLKPIIQSAWIYKVGSLTSLQELKIFTVLNKDGHKIEELKDMTQLRGELCISLLENVHTEEEAMKSRLNEKKHIQKLELNWSSWNIESSGAVLQGLRPNPNIKELTVNNSNGSKIPSWLEDGSLTDLETLEIIGWASKDWDLSLLGQLKSLKKLKARSFLKLPQFGQWKEEDHDSQRFPCLRILVLASCASLKESTYLPLTVEAMRLHDIGWRALPRLQQNRINHTCSSSPSSLTSLHITQCFRLITLHIGLLEHRNHNQLQALQELVIKDCYELFYLPDHGFSALASLKTLQIVNCPKLRYKPVEENGSTALLPSSLLDFKLIKCQALTNDSFFMGMGKLHSLTSMVIKDDRLWGEDDHPPKQTIFTSLPWELLQHFESIKELEIFCCDLLEILELQALVSLKRLKISLCKNLVACSSSAGSPPILLEYLEIHDSSLQMLSTGELLRSLINLQELKIKWCHQLESFPNAMNEELYCLASLKRLYIDRCYGLHSLPHELATIPSLEELIITDCSIESMPENGLPASLVMLVITECPYLKKRCTKEGEDWSKISHVFYIEVDGRNVNEVISSNSASFQEEEEEEEEDW